MGGKAILCLALLFVGNVVAKPCDVCVYAVERIKAGFIEHRQGMICEEVWFKTEKIKEKKGKFCASFLCLHSTSFFPFY